MQYQERVVRSHASIMQYPDRVAQYQDRVVQ